MSKAPSTKTVSTSKRRQFVRLRAVRTFRNPSIVDPATHAKLKQQYGTHYSHWINPEHWHVNLCDPYNWFLVLDTKEGSKYFDAFGGPYSSPPRTMTGAADVHHGLEDWTELTISDIPATKVARLVQEIKDYNARFPLDEYRWLDCVTEHLGSKGYMEEHEAFMVAQWRIKLESERAAVVGA